MNICQHLSSSDTLLFFCLSSLPLPSPEFFFSHTLARNILIVALDWDTPNFSWAEHWYIRAVQRAVLRAGTVILLVVPLSL